MFAETEYPKSVSASDLMQAGKLVKPKARQRASLLLEKFDVKTGEWSVGTSLELLVDVEKFSSGGSRDAILATSSQPNDSQKWVIKKYNPKAKDELGYPENHRGSSHHKTGADACCCKTADQTVLLKSTKPIWTVISVQPSLLHTV